MNPFASQSAYIAARSSSLFVAHSTTAAPPLPVNLANEPAPRAVSIISTFLAPRASAPNISFLRLKLAFINIPSSIVGSPVCLSVPNEERTRYPRSASSATLDILDLTSSSPRSHRCFTSACTLPLSLGLSSYTMCSDGRHDSGSRVYTPLPWVRTISSSEKSMYTTPS